MTTKTPIRFWGTGADNASDVRDNLWLEAKTKDINTQTWTTYTLVLTDQSKIVEMNNASANILTIPANADVAFPVWTTLEITQYGAWITTATWDTGVTVNGTSAGSLATTTQYQSIYLYKRATDEWIAWLKPIEIGWGGGDTYPLNVYESSEQTMSTANAITTLTHSLWLTETDVENGKYKVFLSANFWWSGSQMWDNYWVALGWGSSTNDWYTNWVNYFWNAWSPWTNREVYFQANTVKFKWGTNWSVNHKIRLIIQQVYS